MKNKGPGPNFSAFHKGTNVTQNYEEPQKPKALVDLLDSGLSVQTQKPAPSPDSSFGIPQNFQRFKENFETTSLPPTDEVNLIDLSFPEPPSSATIPAPHHHHANSMPPQKQPEPSHEKGKFSHFAKAEASKFGTNNLDPVSGYSGFQGQNIISEAFNKKVAESRFDIFDMMNPQYQAMQYQQQQQRMLMVQRGLSPEKIQGYGQLPQMNFNYGIGFQSPQGFPTAANGGSSPTRFGQKNDIKM